jgi:uncharacterized membrane protein HdeD (DUF308 family)
MGLIIAFGITLVISGVIEVVRRILARRRQN